MKRPIMYIFLNHGLGMSVGKAAAQAAHAACEAMITSPQADVDAWRLGGHYTKIVLKADDAEQLTTIERYLNDRGFKTSLIIDEGRTEIQPFSKTALGCAIVDKADEHVQATFSSFDLYPHEPVGPQPVDLGITYDVVAAHNHLNRAGRRYHQVLR